MNEAELFDQFLDALRRDPKAAPPPGLDAETADFIRALVAAERQPAPPAPVRDRVWHKALTLAQTESTHSLNGHSTSKGQVEQRMIVLKPSQHISREDDDAHQYDATTLPSSQIAPGARPPTRRHVWQYTLTIAASILIVIAIGALLIDMVSDPIDGYPALVDITEEPTAEPDTACQPDTDYMALGAAGLETGDYEAALAAYQCAIENDPANYAAYVWRGGLAGAAGDVDQLGYDLYTVFSHRHPGSDETVIALARALPTLTTLIAARPDDATLYLLRGLVAYMADLRSNAVNDFAQVIALAPDNAVGYAFRWTFKPETALLDDEDIQKGMELAPNSALMDWILSMEFTQASAELWKPHYDWAIEMNPKHLFAYEARGMANIFLGDMAGAANDFYQHIQNNQRQEILVEATLGTPVKLEVQTGDVYRLTFDVQAGQKLDIFASRGYAALSRVYPPTQVVLNPAGEVLPAPYRMSVAQGDSSTPIRGLEISESGTYTLLVTSNAVGSVTVTISEAR